MKMESLSKEEFAVALRKGQGRALMHVNQFGLSEDKDLVVQAERLLQWLAKSDPDIRCYLEFWQKHEWVKTGIRIFG